MFYSKLSCILFCRDVLHPPIENVKADGYGGIDLIESKNSTPAIIIPAQQCDL